MSAVSEMLHAMAAAVPENTANLPAGVTFPGVVVGGTVHTAANVAKSWIGQPLAEPAAAKLKRKVVAINDADAAGLAEVHFGAARDVHGTVLVLSLGTGIGSALFVDGKLVPNTELGHLEFDGMEAEARASGRARMERKLDWDAYVNELNYVLQPHARIVLARSHRAVRRHHRRSPEPLRRPRVPRARSSWARCARMPASSAPRSPPRSRRACGSSAKEASPSSCRTPAVGARCDDVRAPASLCTRRDEWRAGLRH